MMENEKISWERRVGEMVARLILEESSVKRKQLGVELVRSWKPDERISVMVSFLCELARLAMTRDELGEIINIAREQNLLVVVNPERVKDSPLEGLAVFYDKKAHIPINVQDKRLQALIKSIRQAFSRVRAQTTQDNRVIVEETKAVENSS